MAMKIGQLEIQLVAQMEQMNKTFKSAEGKIGGLVKTAKTAAGALAGLWATDKVFDYISSVADVTVQQMQFAKTLNASYEGLQKITYAAKLADVSSESLQQSLEKMGRGWNSNKVQEGVKALGLNIKELDGLQTDQKLMKIVTALGNIDDAFKRASIAFKIFGKAGMEISKLSIDAGFKGDVNDASNFGVGKITEQDAQVLDEIGDNWERMNTALMTTTQQLLVNWAPTILKLEQKFVNLTAAMVDFMDIINPNGPSVKKESDRKDITGAYYRQREAIDEQFKRGEITKEQKQEKHRKAYEAYSQMVQPELDAKADKAEAKKKLDELQQSLMDVSALEEAYDKKDPVKQREHLEKLRNTMGDDGKSILRDDVYQKELESINDNNPQVKAMKAAQEDIQKEAERMTETMKSPLQKITDEWQKAVSLFNQGLISQDTMDAATKKFSEEEKDIWKTNNGDQLDAFKNNQDTGKNLTDNAKTKFEKLQEEWDKTQELFEGGFISEETLARTQEKLNQDWIKELESGTGNDTFGDIDSIFKDEQASMFEKQALKTGGKGSSGTMADMIGNSMGYNDAVKRQQFDEARRQSSIQERIAQLLTALVQNQSPYMTPA
jgi:hypothetical protein